MDALPGNNFPRAKCQASGAAKSLTRNPLTAWSRLVDDNINGLHPICSLPGTSSSGNGISAMPGQRRENAEQSEETPVDTSAIKSDEDVENEPGLETKPSYMGQVGFLDKQLRASAPRVLQCSDSSCSLQPGSNGAFSVSIARMNCKDDVRNRLNMSTESCESNNTAEAGRSIGGYDGHVGNMILPEGNRLSISAADTPILSLNKHTTIDSPDIQRPVVESGEDHNFWKGKSSRQSNCELRSQTKLVPTRHDNYNCSTHKENRHLSQVFPTNSTSIRDQSGCLLTGDNSSSSCEYDNDVIYDSDGNGVSPATDDNVCNGVGHRTDDNVCNGVGHRTDDNVCNGVDLSTDDNVCNGVGHGTDDSVCNGVGNGTDANFYNEIGGVTNDNVCNGVSHSKDDNVITDLIVGSGGNPGNECESNNKDNHGVNNNFSKRNNVIKDDIVNKLNNHSTGVNVSKQGSHSIDDIGNVDDGYDYDNDDSFDYEKNPIVFDSEDNFDSNGVPSVVTENDWDDTEFIEWDGRNNEEIDLLNNNHTSVPLVSSKTENCVGNTDDLDLPCFFQLMQNGGKKIITEAVNCPQMLGIEHTTTTNSFHAELRDNENAVGKSESCPADVQLITNSDDDDDKNDSKIHRIINREVKETAAKTGTLMDRYLTSKNQSPYRQKHPSISKPNCDLIYAEKSEEDGTLGRALCGCSRVKGNSFTPSVDNKFKHTNLSLRGFANSVRSLLKPDSLEPAIKASSSTDSGENECSHRDLVHCNVEALGGQNNEINCNHPLDQTPESPGANKSKYAKRLAKNPLTPWKRLVDLNMDSLLSIKGLTSSVGVGDKLESSTLKVRNSSESIATYLTASESISKDLTASESIATGLTASESIATGLTHHSEEQTENFEDLTADMHTDADIEPEIDADSDRRILFRPKMRHTESHTVGSYNESRGLHEEQHTCDTTGYPGRCSQLKSRKANNRDGYGVQIVPFDPYLSETYCKTENTERWDKPNENCNYLLFADRQNVPVQLIFEGATSPGAHELMCHSATNTSRNTNTREFTYNFENSTEKEFSEGSNAYVTSGFEGFRYYNYDNIGSVSTEETEPADGDSTSSETLFKIKSIILLHPNTLDTAENSGKLHAVNTLPYLNSEPFTADKRLTYSHSETLCRVDPNYYCHSGEFNAIDSMTHSTSELVNSIDSADSLHSEAFTSVLSNVCVQAEEINVSESRAAEAGAVLQSITLDTLGSNAPSVTLNILSSNGPSETLNTVCTNVFQHSQLQSEGLNTPDSNAILQSETLTTTDSNEFLRSEAVDTIESSISNHSESLTRTDNNDFLPSETFNIVHSQTLNTLHNNIYTHSETFPRTGSNDFLCSESLSSVESNYSVHLEMLKRTDSSTSLQTECVGDIASSLCSQISNTAICLLELSSSFNVTEDETREQCDTIQRYPEENDSFAEECREIPECLKLKPCRQMTDSNNPEDSFHQSLDTDTEISSVISNRNTSLTGYNSSPGFDHCMPCCTRDPDYHSEKVRECTQTSVLRASAFEAFKAKSSQDLTRNPMTQWKRLVDLNMESLIHWSALASSEAYESPTCSVKPAVMNFAVQVTDRDRGQDILDEGNSNIRLATEQNSLDGLRVFTEADGDDGISMKGQNCFSPDSKIPTCDGKYKNRRQPKRSASVSCTKVWSCRNSRKVDQKRPVGCSTCSYSYSDCCMGMHQRHALGTRTKGGCGIPSNEWLSSEGNGTCTETEKVSHDKTEDLYEKFHCKSDTRIGKTTTIKGEHTDIFNCGTDTSVTNENKSVSFSTNTSPAMVIKSNDKYSPKIGGCSRGSGQYLLAGGYSALADELTTGLTPNRDQVNVSAGNHCIPDHVNNRITATKARRPNPRMHSPPPVETISLNGNLARFIYSGTGRREDKTLCTDIADNVDDKCIDFETGSLKLSGIRADTLSTDSSMVLDQLCQTNDDTHLTKEMPRKQNVRSKTNRCNNSSNLLYLSTECEQRLAQKHCKLLEGNTIMKSHLPRAKPGPSKNVHEKEKELQNSTKESEIITLKDSSISDREKDTLSLSIQEGLNIDCTKSLRSRVCTKGKSRKYLTQCLSEELRLIDNNRSKISGLEDTAISHGRYKSSFEKGCNTQESTYPRVSKTQTIMECSSLSSNTADKHKHKFEITGHAAIALIGQSRDKKLSCGTDDAVMDSSITVYDRMKHLNEPFITNSTNKKKYTLAKGPQLSTEKSHRRMWRENISAREQRTDDSGVGGQGPARHERENMNTVTDGSDYLFPKRARVSSETGWAQIQNWMSKLFGAPIFKEKFLQDNNSQSGTILEKWNNCKSTNNWEMSYDRSPQYDMEANLATRLRNYSYSNNNLHDHHRTPNLSADLIQVKNCAENAAQTLAHEKKSDVRHTGEGNHNGEIIGAWNKSSPTIQLDVQPRQLLLGDDKRERDATPASQERQDKKTCMAGQCTQRPPSLPQPATKNSGQTDTHLKKLGKQRPTGAMDVAYPDFKLGNGECSSRVNGICPNKKGAIYSQAKSFDQAIREQRQMMAIASRKRNSNIQVAKKKTSKHQWQNDKRLDRTSHSSTGKEIILSEDKDNANCESETKWLRVKGKRQHRRVKAKNRYLATETASVNRDREETMKGFSCPSAKVGREMPWRQEPETKWNKSLHSSHCCPYASGGEYSAKCDISKGNSSTTPQFTSPATGVTVSDILTTGITALDMMATDATSHDITTTGITAIDIMATGATAHDITTTGITALDIMATDATSHDITTTGITALDIMATGATSHDIMALDINEPDATCSSNKVLGNDFPNKSSSSSESVFPKRAVIIPWEQFSIQTVPVAVQPTDTKMAPLEAGVQTKKHKWAVSKDFSPSKQETGENIVHPSPVEQRSDPDVQGDKQTAQDNILQFSLECLLEMLVQRGKVLHAFVTNAEGDVLAKTVDLNLADDDLKKLQFCLNSSYRHAAKLNIFEDCYICFKHEKEYSLVGRSEKSIFVALRGKQNIVVGLSDMTTPGSCIKEIQELSHVLCQRGL